MNTIQNLIVYGSKTTAPDGTEVYEIAPAKRDAGNKIDVDLKGKLLQFQFQDNTTWICDASTLHEVFPEADAAALQPGKRGGEPNSFELPSYLQSASTDRGIVGTIALKFLKVFAKKAVKSQVRKIAVKLENQNLLNGVESLAGSNGVMTNYLDTGAQLFRIGRDFSFHAFGGKTSKKPYFLFIHGTNSDTLGAFGELKNSAVWKLLHDTYGDNVIAFQHRTLTESPLQNAVKLANLLPDNSVLHVLSHSRGGIVGDILSLYSSYNSNPPLGISNESVDLLKKEGDRENDIKCIQELQKIFRKKKTTVTKFIRVACPAAGTKLASKRLDNILNVFFNLLSAIPGPIPDILKELLEAAVSSKDDINVLPGLEAQNPDSPFIKILNDQSSKNAIDGNSLAVISGNGLFSFSGTGLLVILGRLFYWQRNDLVVNTDSMYLGAKRKNQIQYFFDQGSEVNHVDYFKNRSSCEAIEEAIKTPESQLIPGFKPVAQNDIPGTDRGALGLEHGDLYPYKDIPSGTRPIVVVLPGIMGSNLERTRNKLWLNYLAIIGGLDKLEKLDDTTVRATSVVKSSYNRLAERLKKKYDVVIYPFDWRRPLTDSADDFNNTIKTLLDFKKPIKIIGHSMGGVLVRDFIIHHDATWQKLNKTEGFRLLMLGAPLGGSHRILTVMFGQDALIRKLNMLDRKHSKKELVGLFAKFPGILGLLPLTTDTDNDFAKQETWEKMRNGYIDPAWPIPGARELNAFSRYRDKVLSGKNTIDYSNIYYIAGKDKSTPCDYTFDNLSTRKELLFLSTAKGDQSVTWASGIPAEMSGSNVYYVDVTHGDLADEPDIFGGIEEVLEKGSTELFSHQPLSTRGQDLLFRMPDEVDFDLTEDGAMRSILGKRKTTVKEETRMPLKVRVSNGDLRYASNPVLAGHFISDDIINGEKVIDRCLGNILTAKHQLGLYPGEIGTNDIHDASEFLPGAIIVGLGEPGKFTAHQLSKSVEQGVANYLLRCWKDKESNPNPGISSLIIGCGYGGLSIESSIKAIIEGVNRANERMLNLFPGPETKTIQHIEFVEIYLDKAMSCMYQLRSIEKEGNRAYNIRIDQKKIKTLFGVRKRLPLDATEEWWHRITVKYREGTKPGKMSSMLFSAATTGSRVEESELFSSTALIDLFIKDVSTENKWSPQTAKTLFELMIPNELKDQLKRKGNITWVLDEQSASYPWELLQDHVSNSKPVCINAGMIRQLSGFYSQYQTQGLPKDRALIIADPVLNDFVNQLPGAKAEGKAVETVLTNSGYPCIALINKDPSQIVQSLMLDDGYSILHLAGHGVFNAENPKESGMIIGNGVYLTPASIKQMPATPELAFVNCCFLGQVEGVDEKYYQDRFKLAANIGTQLIQNGVKAVIAAGWAVNDAAATEFAAVFYHSMLSGSTFGEAIKDARTSIYQNYPGDNTWGAYQCYGDHYFKFRKIVTADSYKESEYVVPEEAEIQLDNLLNALATGQNSIEDNLNELTKIMKAVEMRELSSPPIAEKEALIYLELGDYMNAVDRFKRLLKKEKADFSFLCMEKYCNARAKLCVHDFINGKGKSNGSLYKEMDAAIMDLNNMLTAGKTTERLNLLGSAYKRKSMLAINKTSRLQAYQAAAYFYTEANKNAGNGNNVYPVCNALELDFLLNLNGKKWGTNFNVDGRKYSISNLSDAKRKLKEMKEKYPDVNSDMDYWDMVSSLNIQLCELLLGVKGATGKEGWEELLKAFIVLWKKAGSIQKKTAELEHLQFLTFAFASIHGTPVKSDFIADDGFDLFSEKHLEAQFRLMKNAHQRATAKTLKASKNVVASKKKAASKKVAASKKATASKKSVTSKNGAVKKSVASKISRATKKRASVKKASPKKTGRVAKRKKAKI